MSIATELTALSGHITNAYDAVQTKGGTIPANKNMANLDDAILSIQSGADITNGIKIQAKTSSGTVPASTFFEISGAGVVSSNEQNLMDYMYAAQNQQEVQLSENTFFTIYRASTSKTIGASVCQYTNGNVTMGPQYTVATNTFSTTYTPTMDSAIAKVGDNKVLVIYYDVNQSDSSKFSMYGVICTVSGTTITVGTPAVVVAEPYQSIGYVYPYVFQLNQNTAILKYAINSNNTTAVALTISGTTITAGTPVAIDSYAPQYNTIFKISDTTFGMFSSGVYYAKEWDVTSSTISNERTVPSGSYILTDTVSTRYNHSICFSRIQNTNYFIGLTPKKYVIVEFGTTTVTLVESGVVDSEANSSMSHDLVEMSDGSFVYASIRSSTTGATITGTRLCGYRLIWDGDKLVITPYGDLDPDITLSSSYSADLMRGYRTSTDNAVFLYTSNNLSSGAIRGVAINPLTGVVYPQGQISTNDYSANSTNRVFRVDATTAVLFFPYTANSRSYSKTMILSETAIIAESTTRIDGVTVDDIGSSSYGEAWIFEDEIFYGDADTRRF